MTKKCKHKFTLIRVAYGRKDTPVEDQEYYVRELYSSAVGTINEIREVMRKSFHCEPEFEILDER